MHKASSRVENSAPGLIMRAKRAMDKEKSCVIVSKNQLSVDAFVSSQTCLLFFALQRWC